DGRGNAAAVGSYQIPGNAQGTLGFALVGAKSGGVGVASVNVTAPPSPVKLPPQPPFTCPLDQPAQQAQPSQTIAPATPASPATPESPSTPESPATPSPQSAATPVPTGPQASTRHPSQQDAPPSRDYLRSITGIADASLSPAVAHLLSRMLSRVQLSTFSVADGRAVFADVSTHNARGLLDQLRLSPLVVGLGLLWLVVVVVLALDLLRRS